MPLIRRLDTSYKLFACFAILVALGATLALWMLGQLGQLSALAARSGPKAGAAQSLYAGAQVWTWFFISAGIGLASVLALWLRAEVTRPLKAAADMAQRVAGGDLSTRIDEADAAQADGLLKAMQEMNDKLVGMIVKVRSGTESVAGSAAGIAAGGMNLAARAEAQAAALEQAAGAVKQLTANARQSAGYVQQAGAMAVSACDVAARGGAAVANVAGAVAALNDSSGRIDEMVDVIEAIALEASMLAMNAAMEAARAGEPGRSFAVVASEVRNLAQRSAAAAKEIKLLVDVSSARVSGAAALADQAGAAMDDVLASVKRVTGVIGDIAHAGAEQTSGAEQLGLSLAAMDQESRRNARLIGQATAAAASMRDQAGGLSRATAVFSLGKTYAPPGAAIHLVSNNPHKLVRLAPDLRARTRPTPMCVVVDNVPAPALATPATVPMRNRGNAARRDLDWDEF